MILGSIETRNLVNLVKSVEVSRGLTVQSALSARGIAASSARRAVRQVEEHVMLLLGHFDKPASRSSVLVVGGQTDALCEQLLQEAGRKDGSKGVRRRSERKGA